MRGEKSGIRLLWVLLVAAMGLQPFGITPRAAADYAPAGVDSFNVTATEYVAPHSVTGTCASLTDPGVQRWDFVGRVEWTRSDQFSGRAYHTSQIEPLTTSLNYAPSPLPNDTIEPLGGVIQETLDPDRPSGGSIVAEQPGTDFPAVATLSFYERISAGPVVLYSKDPIELVAAHIDSIPPHVALETSPKTCLPYKIRGPVDTPLVLDILKVIIQPQPSIDCWTNLSSPIKGQAMIFDNVSGNAYRLDLSGTGNVIHGTPPSTGGDITGQWLDLDLSGQAVNITDPVQHPTAVRVYFPWEKYQDDSIHWARVASFNSVSTFWLPRVDDAVLVMSEDFEHLTVVGSYAPGGTLSASGRAITSLSGRVTIQSFQFTLGSGRTIPAGELCN